MDFFVIFCRLLTFLSIISAPYGLAKDKLYIGLFESRPFAYKEDNQIKGITKKLADRLFKEHFDVEYTLMPYVRIIDEIAKGRLDITIMYPNQNIQKNTIDIARSMGNDNLIISLKNQNINKLGDIKGRKIAVMKGAAYGKELDLNLIKPLHFLNYTQAMKLMLHGRVEGVIISSAAWKYYIKELNLNIKDYNVIYVNFFKWYKRIFSGAIIASTLSS